MALPLLLLLLLLSLPRLCFTAHLSNPRLPPRRAQMGEVMDANAVLTMTCQRLKEEAGRPEDFSYGDLAAVKKTQAGEVRGGRHP